MSEARRGRSLPGAGGAVRRVVGGASAPPADSLSSAAISPSTRAEFQSGVDLEVSKALAQSRRPPSKIHELVRFKAFPLHRVRACGGGRGSVLASSMPPATRSANEGLPAHGVVDAELAKADKRFATRVCDMCDRGSCEGIGAYALARLRFLMCGPHRVSGRSLGHHRSL